MKKIMDNRVSVQESVLPLRNRVKRAFGGCRRMQGLLVPFAEGELGRKERGRVEAHLAECPWCRIEVEEAASVASLLRAHPPTAAVPSPDLWSQIEAQIAPTPSALPAATALVSAGQPCANNQWRAFWQSFGPSSAVVAATLAGVFFVMGQHKQDAQNPASVGLAKSTTASPAPLADASEITIEFLPAKSRRAATPPHVQVATAPGARVAAPVSASSVVRRRSLRLASSGISHRIRPVEYNASQGRSDNSSISSTITLALVPKPRRVVREMPYRVAVAPTPRAFVPSTVIETLPEAKKEFVDAVVVASADASATVATDEVAVAADEVLAREVPASLSTSDITARLRRQQSLFTYASYAR